MKYKIYLIALMALCHWKTVLATSSEQIDSLGLKDTSGQEFKVNIQKKGVVFIAYLQHCPIMRKNFYNFEELKVKFPEYDFAYVNSQRATMEEINTYKLQIRMIDDPNQALTKLIGQTVAGESIFYGLEKDLKLKKLYQGAINDRNNYDGSYKEVKNKYLENALLNNLKNKSISPEKTATVGCYLTIK